MPSFTVKGFRFFREDERVDYIDNLAHHPDYVLANGISVTGTSADSAMVIPKVIKGVRLSAEEAIRLVYANRGKNPETGERLPIVNGDNSRLLPGKRLELLGKVDNATIRSLDTRRKAASIPGRVLQDLRGDPKQSLRGLPNTLKQTAPGGDKLLSPSIAGALANQLSQERDFNQKIGLGQVSFEERTVLGSALKSIFGDERIGMRLENLESERGGLSKREFLKPESPRGIVKRRDIP
jgi:hypothetical protein